MPSTAHRLARPLRAVALAGWLCSLSFAPALAQRRPPPPPGGDRQITPSIPAQPAPSPAAPQPSPAPGAQPTTPAAEASNRSLRTCEEIRRRARFQIYFDKVDIEKLVQTVADATCRTFILPENIRGKITIIGPENKENGRPVEVDADTFYAAFLAALDSNGLSTYQQGRFIKIVDKQRAKNFTIPTATDPDEPYTTNEQMVTKLFKVKYVDIEPLRGVIQQLVSPSGDTIPFQPDTIIINDIGSNIHRLERIINQLDTRPSSDEIRVIQLQYATAQDITDKVTKLFEARAAKPGQRAGTIAPSPQAPGQPPPGAPGGEMGGAQASGSGGGPATLTQLIPDERTNKLIVVASPGAFDRINALIREIDIPIAGSERINVYRLENAAAEDLASTLQSLAQGTANRPRQPTPAAPVAPGAARGPVQAAELFSGEVKISADKGTNSLVIIASANDYRNLVKVIERLDLPRRQVFVEAVIMEVNLTRKSDFGLDTHGGFILNSPAGPLPVVLGTKYSTSAGLPPSTSLLNLANLGGFLAGLQGPMIPNSKDLLGIEVPAFGVVLHALQTSADVNVLSTPHILTSDNEEAEITVGQNIPFQAGFAPGNLGSLGSLGSTAGTTAATSALAGLGGLGSFFAPINRQNVELKLTVKPQINESDYIRMVIGEQIEEIASPDKVLGPSISKRSAKTTVVAKDQQTVVIGGIMQDRTLEGVSKIPILGDIPLLGHLFRQETRDKVKTNLLLFLTPYIIKDQSDFQRIFERKMKERQQFIEQFYGQIPGYDVAIDFSRKAGPVAKIAQALAKESNKLENGGPGEGGERVFKPVEVTPSNQPPLQGTTSPTPGQAPASDATPGPTAPPVTEPAPAPAPNGNESPRLRVQPGNEGTVNPQ